MDDAMREAREWVMVPREPTEAMLDALARQAQKPTGWHNVYPAMYRALLAAAPAQPSQAGLPDREVIARIVDPKAWVQRQRHLDQAEACEYPDHAEQWIVRADDVVRPSLDIADAIASIRSSAGEGALFEALVRSQSLLEDIDHTTSTNFKDVRERIVANGAVLRTAISGGPHADVSKGEA